MRTIGDLSLSQNERLALKEAKRRLTSEFPIEELIVFCSMASSPSSSTIFPPTTYGKTTCLKPRASGRLGW